MVREREPGEEENTEREKRNTTTRRKQESKAKTRTTDSDDEAHVRTQHRVHPQHPHRGPTESKDEQREGQDDEKQKELERRGAERDQKRMREERKGKDSREQPARPSTDLIRDEATKLCMTHSPAQSPQGHSWDPGIKRA